MGIERNSNYTARFGECGEDVFVDLGAYLGNPEYTKLGYRVAIDNGVHCTTRLTVGDFTHISSHVSIIGGKGGLLEACGFNNICTGARIITVSDAFDGSGLIGTLIPRELVAKQYDQPITLLPMSTVGANAVVMPGATLGVGSVLTIGSVLFGTAEDWSVYSGNPAKKVKSIDGMLMTSQLRQLGYFVHPDTKRLVRGIHPVQWWAYDNAQVDISELPFSSLIESELYPNLKSNPLCFVFDDMQPSDVVFDVGGHVGSWTGIMTGLYDCRSFVFEPNPHLYQHCKSTFDHNKNVEVFDCGLGSESVQTLYLRQDDASSSTFLNDGTPHQFSVVNFDQFCNQHNVSKIKVIKINIEGGEYDLLPVMLAGNYMKNIEYILVQFHDFMYDCHNRRDHIQQSLSVTHELIFNYNYVWELWKIK